MIKTIIPPWAGYRSCNICQHLGSNMNNAFFDLQECPLTIPQAYVAHWQVQKFGACIFWKKVYQNHCWNCKNIISSRFCRKSNITDMGYVCIYCGKDLSEFKRRIYIYA